ncbi:hypothetical protein C8Q70DRAFT_930672 [Cubamyces menziesii]|nr:hypothetical protein C8Q70DRAFT_930672 [Cubamyces menziesii]
MQLAKNFFAVAALLVALVVAAPSPTIDGEARVHCVCIVDPCPCASYTIALGRLGRGTGEGDGSVRSTHQTVFVALAASRFAPDHWERKESASYSVNNSKNDTQSTVYVSDELV